MAIFVNIAVVCWVLPGLCQCHSSRCGQTHKDIIRVNKHNISKMEGQKEGKIVTSDDLVAFMKAMQNTTNYFAKVLSKEIKNGREEINNELVNINKNIEEVKADNKAAEIKNNARFSTLEERMSHLEEINKNVSEMNKRKRITAKPAEGKKTDGFPATQEAGPTLVRQWNVVARDAEISSRDKKNQERAAAAAEYRRLEVLKAKQADVKDKQKDKPNVETKTKTKQVKLRDSSEFHDPEDWDWEDSSEEWDGTVDRTSKMNEKRKLLKKRKHEKQVNITRRQIK